MISTTHALLIVAICSLVTIAIRFAPFLIFRNSTPKPILYLGTVLPYSIMGMLLVYCLKSVSILKSPHGLPEIIALSLVFILHKWKHNTLLSIISGTVGYMLLLHFIF